jgi:hypothetical protein
MIANMSKRTLFLIFALFIITLALLMIAIYQPQAFRTKQITPPPEKPTPQTILSFGKLSSATSSSSFHQPTYKNYSLPVEISTGKNKVTTVQLELMYDQRYIINVSVNPGPFFVKPNIPLNKIDSEVGRISYALSIDSTKQGITGKGIIANLAFSVKNNPPEGIAIIFLPKTFVTAEGINGSALKQTINGLFEAEKNSSTSSANLNK